MRRTAESGIYFPKPKFKDDEVIFCASRTSIVTSFACCSSPSTDRRSLHEEGNYLHPPSEATRSAYSHPSNAVAFFRRHPLIRLPFLSGLYLAQLGDISASAVPFSRPLPTGPRALRTHLQPPLNGPLVRTIRRSESAGQGQRSKLARTCSPESSRSWRGWGR